MSAELTENDVIQAKDMVEKVIYKTCDSDLSYYAKIESIRENDLTISALMPKNSKWKKVEVPHSYKVRGLSEEEKIAFNSMLPTGEKKSRKAKSGPSSGSNTPQPKAKGLASGETMLKCWAKYINENIRTVGGRSKTIEQMTVEFPHKVNAIEKWVDSYAGYYSSGRFAKYGFPRLEVSTPWLLSEAELASGLKQGTARKQDVNRVSKPRKVKEEATTAA